MELSPRFVGAVSKSLKTSVTWRHAMNYAAAVGDGNPFYFDDEREGGIIAPPMLAVALTWPIAEHMPQFWPADGFPLEVLQRQVHMTEHLIWHRTMRPGDALTITGEAVAIAP
ncbi:MAG: MaoC family dehydratase N-terminal domain-containing protein, partial [Candidatus Hydrogenedentes bacterium]|nr:MaoC family dehydratase N-terminal domain-containing protein [Candidatus Hydrogenedentota bacterium]